MPLIGDSPGEARLVQKMLTEAQAVAQVGSWQADTQASTEWAVKE